jgi:hypothetical protein
MDEARAATWAAEAEREYAKDAHEEEAENNYSEYMVVPSGLPTCGHHANGHQANSENLYHPRSAWLIVIRDRHFALKETDGTPLAPRQSDLHRTGCSALPPVPDVTH